MQCPQKEKGILIEEFPHIMGVGTL